MATSNRVISIRIFFRGSGSHAMPLAERLAVSACVGEQGLVAVDEYTIKSIQLIFGHFAFIRIAVVVSFLRSI